MSRAPRFPPIVVVTLPLAILLATGCTHKPAPGESIADVCRLANNGREVRASGYLHAPMLVGCDKTDCRLQVAASQKKAYGLSVVVPLGGGPNTMTPLPPPRSDTPRFTVERVSVALRDASGDAVDVGDVVRVTGVMTAYESGGELRCTLAVAKLERL